MPVKKHEKSHIMLPQTYSGSNSKSCPMLAKTEAWVSHVAWPERAAFVNIALGRLCKSGFSEIIMS